MAAWRSSLEASAGRSFWVSRMILSSTSVMFMQWRTW